MLASGDAAFLFPPENPTSADRRRSRRPATERNGAAARKSSHASDTSRNRQTRWIGETNGQTSTIRPGRRQFLAARTMDRRRSIQEISRVIAERVRAAGAGRRHSSSARGDRGLRRCGRTGSIPKSTGTEKLPRTRERTPEEEAEAGGLEPPRAFARRISSAVPYQLDYASGRTGPNRLREDGDPLQTAPSIGAPGFEPGTSATRTQRSTGLSHAPRLRVPPAADGVGFEPTRALAHTISNRAP